jgi:hypothetical protein
MEGVAADPEGHGLAMVKRLLELGAGEILAEIRDTTVVSAPAIDVRLET